MNGSQERSQTAVLQVECFREVLLVVVVVVDFKEGIRHRSFFIAVITKC